MVRMSYTDTGPHLTPIAADTVVKVPQMAESITEGTLKQWSKRVYSSKSFDRAWLTTRRGRRLR